MSGAGWRQVISDGVAAKAAQTRAKNRGASNVARISRVGLSVQIGRAHV